MFFTSCKLIEFGFTLFATLWVCGEGETRHENFMSVQIVLNALAGYNRRHKDEVKVTTLVTPPSDCS